MAVTRFEDLDLSRRYTYADYLSWKFQERVELFRGWVMKMAGPNVYHQRVSGDLYFNLRKLSPDGCQVFAAPTDVLLKLSEEGDTVVQPDLLIVCDAAKLKKQHIEGAPDFIVEIVSPGNAIKELDKKYRYYEEAGVREYWVIQPEDKTLLRFVLNDEGRFVGLAPHTVNSKEIACSIFPGVVLKGEEVFPE